MANAYGQMDPEGSWPTGADTTMASDWTPLACNDAAYARMGMSCRCGCAKCNSGQHDLCPHACHRKGE